MPSGHYYVKDALWRELGDEMWYFLSRPILQTWINDEGTNHKVWSDVNTKGYHHGDLSKAFQYDEVVVFDEQEEDYQFHGKYRFRLLDRQFVEYRMYHTEALARTLKMYSKAQLDRGMAPFNVGIYIPFYLEYNAREWAEGNLHLREPPEGLPTPTQMVINPPPEEFMILFVSRMAAMREIARAQLHRYDEPWLRVLSEMTIRDEKLVPHLQIEDTRHSLAFAGQQIIIHFDELERKAEVRLVDVKLTALESAVDKLEREFEQFVREHPGAPSDYPTIAVLMNKLEYFELREKLGERL